MADLREKFLGAIVGCAVGDALGAPFEGIPLSVSPAGTRRNAQYVKIPGYPVGQYTDDTQLTLAVMRAICRVGRIDGAVIAEEFVELWRTGEIVGAGASCSEAVFNIYRLGMSWENCGTPEGRAGNGSAMRAAPIGLWNYEHPADIKSDGEICSIITHKDPRAIAGSIAVARAVSICTVSDEIDPRGFLRQISREAREASELFAQWIDELTEWLDLAPEEALPFIYSAGEPDMGPRKPEWVTPYVIPTVLCALYYFLKYPRDYFAAVTGTICAGGDVDTIAAITGAISGAFNGISSIPKNLVDTLKDSEEIAGATEQFYRKTMSRD